MREPTRKLLLLWIISVSILIPLYININILHYQTDPFISTTINIGKLILVHGNLNEARHFVLNNWLPLGWQGHTRDFIQYEPLSGVLVYGISIIANLPINHASYLPIPYFVYLVLLYLIMKWIYSFLLSEDRENVWKPLILFILFASGYAYVCLFVLGTFYVFEYHGIYYTYTLIMYYLILKIISNNEKTSKKLTLLVILTFLANLFTHYEIPLTITGGLIMYYFIVQFMFKISNTNKPPFLEDLKVLWGMFFILILSQGFYYYTLSRSTGIIQLIPSFLSYMVNRIISGSSGQIIKGIYSYGAYLLLFKKGWHIWFAITVLLQLFIATSLIRKYHSKIPVIFSYLIVLGRDISWMISYFAMYLGSFSFEFKTAWLLNMSTTLPTFGVLNNSRKKTFLLAFSIVLSILLVGWSTLYAHMLILGDSPYPGQVKDQAKTVSPFITANLPIQNITIITGSLQGTSAIYEDIPTSNLDNLYLVPSIFYIKEHNTKQHIPVFKIPNTLKKEGVNFVIITSYETTNAFYGGLTIAPLTENDMMILNELLFTYYETIYSSDLVKLYKVK